MSKFTGYDRRFLENCSICRLRPATAANTSGKSPLFRRDLAKNGLRLTRQREMILDFFLNADRHLSQEDIYGALRKHGIGRATVFRTLKMLEECGIVNHVVAAKARRASKSRSTARTTTISFCVDCGRIQENPLAGAREIQEKTCKKLGFTQMASPRDLRPLPRLLGEGIMV